MSDGIIMISWKDLALLCCLSTLSDLYQ